VGLFLLINVLAYLHARAMTHFVSGGDRTQVPEKLTMFQKAKVLLTGVTIPRPENRVTPESLGLPFETHRIDGNGGPNLEAWLLPHPHGKAVVLLFHGYSASKTELLSEARVLHELGYAPFLVDFRGSGGSGGDETSIGVYEADDVARAVDYVRGRWPEQRLILYGYSMGSAAIFRALALGQTHADAVILEAPFDRLTSTVANRFTAMGLPTFPGTPLLVFWGGVQQGFNGFRHNPVEYAAAVCLPVLMMHGEGDVRATKAQVQAVFDQLAGPKQIEPFDGVGHQPTMAADAARWKRVIGRFLETHLAAPAGSN
jgi:alpha-beta hydrolase superfamily lysophospholipase